MHPHQLLLELLAETGLIGLLWWFAGAVLASRAYRRAGVAARDAAFAPGLALVAMTFPLNSHFAFYSSFWALLFWWLVALGIAALAQDTEARA
jgi:O-antigen ligase